MDTRIETTIKELKNNGWTFQAFDQKTDWWIDEAFELISVWSPIGSKIYFTLDVDPEATSNRRKGKGIISISLSKSIPTTRLSTEQITFYLSELDKKGIEKLVSSANKLRNENKTLPNKSI